jgi:two-component system response regulator FlrC
VIATTNRDLRQCVINGSFREDLYYRLSVFPLQWLPLRMRRKDILPLAQRLLQRHGKKMGRSSLSFDLQARHMLETYAWPGNVRELDNVIQRALIIQDGNVISGASLALEPLHMSGGTYPASPAFTGSEAATSVKSLTPPGITELEAAEAESEHGVLGSDLKQREFEIILHTLRQQGGRRKETADVLGVSARTLRYKMARMRDSGINIESMLTVI